MKKYSFYFLFLFAFQLFFSQNNNSWKSYPSYGSVREISISSNKVFVATENAIFSKNIATNEIKTKNTVDGLSGETISAFYHSEAFNKTIIGYENGLISVLNETNGRLTDIADIVIKTLPSNMKKINNFMEYQGIVYISCDFGIVQLNLNSLQFGDTYFIGTNGAEITVKETAVFNGYLFAATSDGIKKALLANPNLNDYNQWKTIVAGSWLGIGIFNNELLALRSGGSIQKYNLISDNFSQLIVVSNVIKMRSSLDYLVLMGLNSVFIYNTSMSKVREIKSTDIPKVNLKFNCATNIGNSIIIGTFDNGLYTTTTAAGDPIIDETPNGPLRNSIFSFHVTSNSLWAVYGDYSFRYNPYEPGDPNLPRPAKFGISKLNSGKWLHIPFEKLFGARSIVRIVSNPKNENEVYASSFFSGLIKIENDVPTVLYDTINSKLESLLLPPPQLDIRVNGLVFNKDGELWLNNCRTKYGLKMIDTNENVWVKFSTEAITKTSSTNFSSTDYGRIIIDNFNTKWICSNRVGLIGYNEEENRFRKIDAVTGNLPNSDVRSVAVDKKNQLWIGTSRGLRILKNAKNFLNNGSLITEPIIILENGLGQELMQDQFITDIVVDGANNKWIGTAENGVFLVSANGQETKYHFTTINSPLPSNNINDIEINERTGEVYIATAKGMVSFSGTATRAKEDLNSVFIYPNPVRPGYEGTVKISGLVDKANVKITDITGNLVYETTSEGGTIEWDTTAFDKHKVATGVYVVFISSNDGNETKVKKVMIVR